MIFLVCLIFIGLLGFEEFRNAIFSTISTVVGFLISIAVIIGCIFIFYYVAHQQITNPRKNNIATPNDNKVWSLITQQFVMSTDEQHSDVQRQINADLQHPKYIHRLTENARPYLYYVFQQTKKYHMPAELTLLPMVLSEYKPNTSEGDAVGLWQLTPSIAHDYGIKMNFWYDGRRSTEVSTKVALHFLSYLYQTFHHNWLLALAAYNAGPGTVMEAIRYNQEHGRPTNFWALPLPEETKIFVPKLLALAAIIHHPHTYGINLAYIPNMPITDAVTVNEQMKLSTIARLTNTTVNTVKALNPALRRDTTPPNQVVTLILPILHEYKVKPDDSLASIASKYNTSIETLQKINQLRDGLMRINEKLLIPMNTAQTLFQKNEIHN